MTELITRISDKVGIAPEKAEKAVATMLDFLQREADSGPVTSMIKAVPGASELVTRFNGSGSGTSLFGKFVGAVGGGLMALGQQLMSQGLSMGEITRLAKETLSYAREHAGDENVDAVVNSVLGLRQFT